MKLFPKITTLVALAIFLAPGAALAKSTKPSHQKSHHAKVAKKHKAKKSKTAKNKSKSKKRVARDRHDQ